MSILIILEVCFPGKTSYQQIFLEANGWAFFMPRSHLFFSEFKLNESESDMLILSPRYTSPTISSNTQPISLRLIIVVAYCPE